MSNISERDRRICSFRSLKPILKQTAFRRALSVTIVVGFVLTISGAALFWHIILHGGPKEHGNEHCSFYHQNVINQSNSEMPPEVNTEPLEEFFELVFYKSESLLKSEIEICSLPRAPPFVLIW